jgi:hypothetical protein
VRIINCAQSAVTSGVDFAKGLSFSLCIQVTEIRPWPRLHALNVLPSHSRQRETRDGTVLLLAELVRLNCIIAVTAARARRAGMPGRHPLSSLLSARSFQARGAFRKF